MMPRMNEYGTSLLELVVSMAVTGILSAIMGTELMAMVDRVHLQAATSEVIVELRNARELAIRERQPIYVAVDESHATMTITRQSDPAQPVKLMNNLRGVTSIRSSAGPLVTFFPRGTSATPTTLTLEGRDGAKHVVTVGLTGIVRAR